MKITIIHGSPRKGNTYRTVQMVKSEMLKHGEAEFKEYFLPRDMPEFCQGCYNCFFKGESQCPHAKYVQPIVADMLTSDGLILTSPVYALSESACIKALLDHLAYMFMPHRPQKEMFSKKALVISTTAGAGTHSSIKPIATSLKYWGVNKIHRCGIAMWSLSWDDMKAKRKKHYTKKVVKCANLFYNDVASNKRHLPSPVQWIMFHVSRQMIKGEQASSPCLDSAHWLENGWLDGKTPFH